MGVRIKGGVGFDLWFEEDIKQKEDGGLRYVKK